MVELAVRLALAGVFLAVSAVGGHPPFDLAWPIVAFFGAYSAVAYLFDIKGLRNPGTSGFIAVADAGAIAYLTVTLNCLDTFGFLVLLPLTYAAARYGSNPAAMAPIAASWLLVGSNLQGGFTPLLLIQALSVLSIGLLLNQGRIVMTVTRDTSVVPLAPTYGPDPTQYMELRENFRRLKDHCKELERKGRRDFWAMKLLETQESSGARLAKELCVSLKELTGVDGVSIYTINHLAARFALLSKDGDLPEDAAASSFEYKKDLSEAQLKHRIDVNLKALKRDNEKQRSATVILKHKGLMTGVLALHSSSVGAIDDATRIAEEAAPIVAAILFKDDRDRQIQRRIAEAELQYKLAAVANGAESTTSLCARVVRELWDGLSLDHLGAFILDGESSIQAASSGTSIRFLETMGFEGVSGIPGWIAAGCPPLTVHDATTDERCNRLESVKRRVGSFVLLPINDGDQNVGYLTAATHQSGSIGAPEMDSLRLIAAELGQAIGRLQTEIDGPTGLMTPREFNESLGGNTDGCLVYLEPLHREEMIQAHGLVEVTQALRAFGVRVRSILPQSGLLCRRTEEDFVAFLAGKDEETARRWANEAAALASLVPVRSNGKARIPLAVRARVAVLSQQNNLISEVQIA